MYEYEFEDTHEAYEDSYVPSREIVRRNLAEKVGFVIVCYANAKVVRNTVEKALTLDIPLYLVDNCSPDPETRRYLQAIEERKNVNVLRPGKNLGCHNGFNYGFDYVLSQRSDKPDLLIKCDDDTVPPLDLDLAEILSLFRERPNIAFCGTNFFSDGRISEWTDIAHGGSRAPGDVTEPLYSTNFAYWKDIINIPFGIIRTSFYEKFGLMPSYRMASGEIMTDIGHLYGGEEAYLCQKAQEEGMEYGYLMDYKPELAGNDLIDPDYILWKFHFGYLGSYKLDFATFKKDEATKREAYQYWLDHSENGMHRKWSREYLGVKNG